MGGKAFASGPDALSTPRMPPILYHALLDRFLALSSNFFERVTTSVEAPEKTSFGDVDIIVSEPKARPFPPEQFSSAFNAKRIIALHPMYSFAVPHPDLDDSYVQLDLQICQPQDFYWEVFHKSHGDLWNLLGSSIRPFGLTANDKGLHLRIPEIEEHDRKQSLIFLTADPGTVLNFLHLDGAAYTQPFDTVDEMFEFACSNRFFRPEAYVRDGLKANDRKRMTQRNLYRLFVDEFVPRRTATSQANGSAERLTRQQVLEEALHKFERKPEYEARVKAWRMEREELAHKSEAREWRKARAVKDSAYADAWIDAVRPTAKKQKVDPEYAGR